jgi:hypothetical protein
MNEMQVLQHLPGSRMHGLACDSIASLHAPGVGDAAMMSPLNADPGRTKFGFPPLRHIKRRSGVESENRQTSRMDV